MPWPSGQLIAQGDEAVGVEEVGDDLGRQADVLDEAAPRVVDLRLGLVLGEAAHDLGRLHQRVVGAERLRRVTRRARHPQRAPEGALLADDHRQAHACAEVGIGKPPASVIT